jgi:LysM repeat protein
MNYTTDPRVNETRLDDQRHGNTAVMDRESDLDQHQDLHDQDLGVYVRSQEQGPAHELDLLWSGNRGHHLRDDRSPVVSFAFGAIVGAALTAALAFFFFIKPEIKSGDTTMADPVTAQQVTPQVNPETVAAQTGTSSTVTTVVVPGEGAQTGTAKPPEASVNPIQALVQSATGQPAAPQQTASAQTPAVQTATPAVSSMASSKHVVKNGDTLESIARKYYGSGTPDLISKIQRANNMKNPNRLKLDQELVIPPKSY